MQQWQDTTSASYWYGTINASGTTLHVAVLSGKPGLIALASKYVATVVQIVEPKPMDDGKVTVDGKRLSASGVANYAPLASNANETGRARRRRVEMVLQ